MRDACMKRGVSDKQLGYSSRQRPHARTICEATEAESESESRTQETEEGMGAASTYILKATSNDDQGIG